MSHNPEPLNITDDDVDYVAEAFAESIAAFAERIGEGRDGRNAFLCKVRRCLRSAEWSAVLELAHPAHGTPEPVELELCEDHAREWRLDYQRHQLTYTGLPVRKMTARRVA